MSINFQQFGPVVCLVFLVSCVVRVDPEPLAPPQSSTDSVENPPMQDSGFNGLDSSIVNDDQNDPIHMENRDAASVSPDYDGFREMLGDALSPTLDATPAGEGISSNNDLDAGMTPDDDMILSNIADTSPMNIDPCRQPIIDGAFALLGFSYVVTRENDVVEEGCVSEINTSLLSSNRGSVTWRGVFNSSRSDARFRLSMGENIERQECTQTLTFGGSQLSGIENLTLGIPEGSTDFIFNIMCDGRLPDVTVSLEDVT